MALFKSEKKAALNRMEEVSKEAPPTQLTETPTVEDKAAAVKKPSFMAGWKTRSNAAKAAVSIKPAKDLPTIPQTPEQEQDIEQVKLGEAVIEQEQLEKKNSELTLNADNFFEVVTNQMLPRELTMKIFCDEADRNVQLNLDGLTKRLEELQIIIATARTQTQAVLAQRGELLKNVSSEERERRMKSDWDFLKSMKAKPSKSNGETKSKTAKAPKESAIQQIERTLFEKYRAKGMAEDVARAKAKKNAAGLGDD